MTYNEFLHDWFGTFGGREVGNPNRIFIRIPEQLITFKEECTKLNKPCYMSVNPYKKRNIVYGLEKLFFDFDSKENPPNLKMAFSEASDFVKQLKKWYNIDAFLVFSGRRGYHVYVWFKTFLELEPHEYHLGKQVANIIQNMFLAGLNYKTVDPSCIGDIKRISRVPYTIHEVSGYYCAPIDETNLENYTKYGIFSPPSQIDLDKYCKNGIRDDLVKDAVSRIPSEMKAPPPKRYYKVRPCIEGALKNRDLPNEMRLVVCYELLNNNYSVDEVIDAFRNQTDFDERVTRYQVEYAKRRGYLPYRCSSIRDLGYCLNSGCSIFRKQIG